MSTAANDSEAILDWCVQNRLNPIGGSIREALKNVTGLIVFSFFLSLGNILIKLL